MSYSKEIVDTFNAITIKHEYSFSIRIYITDLIPKDLTRPIGIVGRNGRFCPPFFCLGLHVLTKVSDKTCRSTSSVSKMYSSSFIRLEAK